MSEARLPMQAQLPPLRIIWLADGPYVTTQPVERVRSVNQSTGNEYEHDVACCSCRVLRKATTDEVREWRIRT